MSDDQQTREIRAYSDRLMAADSLEAAILLVAMLGKEALMRIDMNRSDFIPPSAEWIAEQRNQIMRLLRRMGVDPDESSWLVRPP